MENSQILSTHVLKTDYSIKGKLKTIIIGWVVFLVIFIVTRFPAVQAPVNSFAADFNHSGLTSVINFIFNGLWVFFIPLVLGTILTLRKKHPYNAILVYDTGIGFQDAATKAEWYAPYSEIELRYGKMQQGFCIKCPRVRLSSEVEYGWGEFTHPDTLRNNLERYATIAS